MLDSITKRFILVCTLLTVFAVLLITSQIYFEGKIVKLHQKELLLLELRHKLRDLDGTGDDLKNWSAQDDKVVETLLGELEAQWQVILDTLTEYRVQTDLVQARAHVQIHKTLFLEMLTTLKKIGVDKDDGVQRDLRKQAHHLEVHFANEGDEAAQILLLQMRRAEKDFMLRHDPQYKVAFDQHTTALLALPIAQSSPTKALLMQYVNSVSLLVEKAKLLGLGGGNGLRGRYQQASKRLLVELDRVEGLLLPAMSTQEFSLRIGQVLAVLINMGLIFALAVHTFLIFQRAVSQFLVFFEQGKYGQERLRPFDFETKEFMSMAELANDMIDARVSTEEQLKAALKEREGLNKELEVLAKVDPLTGLANRRSLDEQFDLEWERSIACADPLSIMLVDIDNFKAYNDNYGHAQGDQVLKEVAQTLKHSLSPYAGFAARYGGEEFFVMLPSRELPEAERIAKELVDAIHQCNILHKSSANDERVTISVGVYGGTPSKSQSISRWFMFADKALYFAKQSGRNQVKSHKGATLLPSIDKGNTKGKQQRDG